MAAAVTNRCIDHIASLPTQPILGDVNADALCRSLREPAPEAGSELEPLLDLIFDQCIPRSFNAPAPGYLAYVPGGGLYPAALANFIADTTNRFTGVWMAAPALVQLEANGARLAARLDGIPGHGARSVHDRRIDGHLQRHPVRARTLSRHRHPRRRALHLRPGASLAC